MKVDIFTLCDFARNEPGNKMTIVGTFNQVFAPAAPVTYPLCALAVQMRFERIEEGTKQIRVTLIDSDGQPVMPQLNAQMPVRFNQSDSDAIVPLVLIMQQIKLPRFGEYSFDLAVDGRQEAAIPLYVRQYQQPAQAPQAPPPQ